MYPGNKEPLETKEVLLSHLHAVLKQQPHLVSGTDITVVLEQLGRLEEGDLMAMLGDWELLHKHMQCIQQHR